MEEKYGKKDIAEIIKYVLTNSKFQITKNKSQINYN